jgi:hypothetical protein
LRRLGCCAKETAKVQNDGTQSEAVKEEGEVVVRVADINDTGTDWTTCALAAAQGADEELGPIYRFLQRQDSDLDAVEPPDRVYLGQRERLKLRAGVLYRRWLRFDGAPEAWQLIPPRSHREQLMKIAHVGMTGGHLALRRMLAQVQARAYWAGSISAVKRFVQSCPECAQYHRGKPPRQGRMQDMSVRGPNGSCCDRHYGTASQVQKR